MTRRRKLTYDQKQIIRGLAAPVSSFRPYDPRPDFLTDSASGTPYNDGLQILAAIRRLQIAELNTKSGTLRSNWERARVLSGSDESP